jgi:3beta-hydroxy-Delta5-steroid dehydrogenase / steroid Delta-isomerase
VKRVLVTGGAGFVGNNLTAELLKRGYWVRTLDIAASPLNSHPRLETVVGDIRDSEVVARSVDGVDTVFHTAAMLGLLGGRAVSHDYRQLMFAVNVEATKELIRRSRDAGVSRFVYTSSNSVVMGDQPIVAGDEALPYTSRFVDLYTETKVEAEAFVLSNNGIGAMMTCAIRPSGIWGPGDQTMFRKIFEQLVAGRVRVLVGRPGIRMDTTYIANLVHGQLLAAEQLHPLGTACGQAYFITDEQPINVFEFARPIVEACGQHWPRVRVPGRAVYAVMAGWQWLHFRLGLPAPPLEPLVVNRLCVDNFYATEKARRDLGYRPLVSIAEAIEISIPYYRELFETMQRDAARGHY